MGADDRSPAVVMITNSAGWPLAIKASLTTPAWVVASKLPRVPIRITFANRLLCGLFRAAWQTTSASRAGARVESG